MELVIPGRAVPAVRMTQSEAKSLRYGEPKNPLYKAKYLRIKRYLDYKDSVGWIGRTKFPKPLTGPVVVDITVYVSGGIVGDWDNYGKAICDGLNKIAYLDDRQITSGQVKIINQKGVEERTLVSVREG